MMKKIAIFLFVLLIVQILLYARLYATELVLQAETITRAINSGQVEEGKDYDVNAYLKSLGIQTSVNEDLLEERYHGATLVNDPVGENTTIRFYNPKANNYRLDIYDVSNGLVASFVNFNSDNVTINKTMFDAGSYIFKLSGESNIYCGTFVLR